MGRLIDADVLMRDIEKYHLSDGKFQHWVEVQPTIEPEKAIKDCRNCKSGKYNDYYGIRFCYESDDCVDWNLWEPKEEPEIIMCKDCIYSDEEPISDGRYWCSLHGSFMNYCSDAKGKTDE